MNNLYHCMLHLCGGIGVVNKFMPVYIKITYDIQNQ